jgi:hypothetical protein
MRSFKPFSRQNKLVHSSHRQKQIVAGQNGTGNGFIAPYLGGAESIDYEAFRATVIYCRKFA